MRKQRKQPVHKQRKQPLRARLLESQPGFTLIEVMIAMTLLAFLGIALYQATARSYTINGHLSQESADYSAVVLGLEAIRSDMQQIYSPPIDPTVATPTDNQGLMEFWSAPLRADGVRRARFKGTPEKVTFINNGTRRVDTDSPISDFQKITWEISRGENNAYSLFRASDWDAFRYDENSSGAKKPVKISVLDNLSSGKFSYYRRETKNWEDSWDSESPYNKPEYRFPDLIQLKIDVPDPLNSANQQTWQVIVRPNMPLNGEVVPNDGDILSQ